MELLVQLAASSSAVLAMRSISPLNRWLSSSYLHVLGGGAVFWLMRGCVQSVSSEHGNKPTGCAVTSSSSSSPASCVIGAS
eukprot:1596011-Rhodomonas_salina.1